jgi:hypothetical protein
MSGDDDEVLIPFLDEGDFEKARLVLEDYRSLGTYDDFVCDREGRLVGLGFAGRPARLVAVSFDGFLAWCGSIQALPTSAGLEAFAAMIEAFRREPQACPEPFIVSPAEQVDSAARGRLRVPVDATSYRSWLACLGAPSSPDLLDAYASLVIESWAGSMVPADQGSP